MHDRIFKPSDAHKLDDPERLLWLPPQEVLRRVGVLNGMTVADIGAGTGYFTFPLAAVAAKVYAVDLQREMLEILKSRLEGAPQGSKIQPGVGSAETTGLPGNSCDLVFLGNVWHELEHLDQVLAELRRILRPEGMLAIVDWHPDRDRPPGPPLDHRLPATTVESVLKAAGWRILESGDVARYHYLVKATI